MDDDSLIPISALQHYLFCPRQCALIHIEQQWADNFLTAEGSLLHQRVDFGAPETRRGIHYERGVVVCAPSLCLTGKLDLLEKSADIPLLPVEYKRGRPKKSDCDVVQLCAQGLCLEEMTGIAVTEGALWYWQTRHRVSIPFDTALRQRTISVIHQVKQLFECAKTPPPVFGKRCKSCSLLDICCPQLIDATKSTDYMKTLFKTEDSA